MNPQAFYAEVISAWLVDNLASAGCGAECHRPNRAHQKTVIDDSATIADSPLGDGGEETIREFGMAIS